MAIKYFLFCHFVLFVFIVSLSGKQAQKLNIGVILDLTSRDGKEAKVAMQLALEDFYANASFHPTLRVKDSHGDSMTAISSAKTLIKKHHVSAILGLGTWQDTALVSKLGDKFEVPLLSLANEVPIWAFQHWPFLVNAGRSQFSQMKAVAAIIQSWQWRKVNIIYEDINSAATGVIPYLISSLQEAGSEINDLLPLSPLPAYSLSEKLKHLKSGQCRVFVVHTSEKLAVYIFSQAKKLGMMKKEFVWITTVDITNSLDTFKASVISSMQGLLGVKSYYNHSSKLFKSFLSKFHEKFHLQYKNDLFSEPRISALQAYDAMWAVALAMEGLSHRKIHRNSTELSSITSIDGEQLLTRIKYSNFEGLTGAFIFRKGMLAPDHIFRIVNLVGKSYHELGYWTEKLGFSERIGIGGKYNKSMIILGQVHWPGGPWSVPRGWATPTNARPLKVGVPTSNSHKDFINVNMHNRTVSVSGFSIDVFLSTLSFLPYALPHIYVPFNGTYDSLVQQIKLQNFDAVVADTAIVANRCQYAEFSQPYGDSGLQMLVYVKPKKFDRAWLFTKPLTASMWIIAGIVNIYNGFVVWLIERTNTNNNDSNNDDDNDNHNALNEGNTIWERVGKTLLNSFITLFSLKAYKLNTNLSRMVMVAWLFVALVLTQSYTANLTTILTAQRLDPELIDVGTLRQIGAKVGCDGNSFVVKYLERVLKFKPENIVRIYSEDQYVQALSSGEIRAAFLEVPYVKLFLAKYCRGFSTSGLPFKVGGFGFVFPRNSPILPDISEAILKVTESGKLKDLENSLTNDKCLESVPEHSPSLGIESYWGLFVITGGTSTIALVIFGFCQWWFPQQRPGPQPEPEPEGHGPEPEIREHPEIPGGPVERDGPLPDEPRQQHNPAAVEAHRA